jgi:hypothetical protein
MALSLRKTHCKMVCLSHTKSLDTSLHRRKKGETLIKLELRDEPENSQDTLLMSFVACDWKKVYTTAMTQNKLITRHYFQAKKCHYLFSYHI